MPEFLTTSVNVMLPDLHATKKEEVIKKLCDKALENGYVDKLFYDDLIAREKEFPTGLDTSIPMAISHVGTHCLKSFLALATLQEPVEFENMDGSEKKVFAGMVFVFGIVRPEEQVVVLRKLSGMFQEPEYLERIMKSKTPDALLAVMSEFLGDMLCVE